MTTMIATHAVGNMDTWLRGGDDRKVMFANFCSSYRIFRHTASSMVAIVGENVDLEKMKATLSAPETAAAKAAHTVIDPIEIYIEVDGGK